VPADVCSLQIPGVTTIVCFLPVYFLKLNVVAAQIVNQILGPVNMISCKHYLCTLVVACSTLRVHSFQFWSLPAVMFFIRQGERLLRAEPVEVSLEAIKSDPLGAVQRFGGAFARGVFAWSLVAVPATILLYYAFRPIVRRSMRPREPQAQQAQEPTQAAAAPAAAAASKQD
jgi:hypothetical protein